MISRYEGEPPLCELWLCHTHINMLTSSSGRAWGELWPYQDEGAFDCKKYVSWLLIVE